MPLTIALDARLIATHNTGDTSYWRGLIHGFSQLDIDARFLLFSNTKRPQIVPDDPRFEWIEVHAASNRIWSLSTFPKEAMSRGAQIFHTQYNLSPQIKKGGITTIHDVSFCIEPRWFRMRDLLILRTQIPSTIKRADAILTVSETSQREIIASYPAAAGKTHVTYNALGANITPWDREKAKSHVAQKFGITDPYVFTLGTRWPRKNMTLAVAAVDQLPQDNPLKIVVTGQPGWGEEYRSSRRITTGFVSDDDLSALYSAAELYLAPSWHEGFGIPLLEAWACDCPVLCSPGGALPEVAANAAEVAPDWEAATWTGLIQRLLADSGKLEQLRQAGHQRLTAFDWVDTAQKTWDVYCNVSQ